MRSERDGVDYQGLALPSPDRMPHQRWRDADGMSALIELNDALHRHADGALEAHHDRRVIDLDRAEIGEEREKRRREGLARQGAAGRGGSAPGLGRRRSP